MKPVLSGVVFAGLLLVQPGTVMAYNYDNELRNTALMKESCEKSLAQAAGSPAMKSETCTCFIIGISASGPNTVEVKSLVENGFMDELTRLNGVRPGGWHPAIRKCFR
ncbi:MAG: hypothetical protein SH859_07480 [Hyphomicrobium aestuarii]|nr:hypothetical protein [Hyphomicrobium aestuarii]